MLSDSDRALLKGQLFALGGVKLFASILTLYHWPNWYTVLAIIVLSIPWVIGGAWYLGRSGWFRYRYWQYRHLRRRLIHEEWNVGEDPAETIRRGRGRQQ